MSRALSAYRPLVSHGIASADALHAAMAWPSPHRLAELGTVLCLYRADSSELGGWRQAVAAHACQSVDSEGVHESLCFTDARGRCCWRLYLLPDSDFLAWDRLVSQLPTQAPGMAEGSVSERLWRRLAGHLGGQRWRMSALNLHAVEQGQSLAASVTTLSSLGAASARRIARLEGAEGDIRVDDCCCASAARNVAPAASAEPITLVRF